MKRSILLIAIFCLGLAASAQQIPEGYERVLLPVFTPAIHGAHGSLFYSDFRLMNRGSESLTAYGIFEECMILCPEDPLLQFELEPGVIEEAADFYKKGSPGWFLLVPGDRKDDLVMQLRAYDESRESTNFGTEIPVVHADEMRPDEITLLGVPTDSRFRNTLRIYSTHQQPMHVTVENASGLLVDQVEHLSSPTRVLDPAYAAFVQFPANAGPVRVRVWSALPEIVTPPVTVPDFWAFITVTNNDTQHITVISPQR